MLLRETLRALVLFAVLRAAQNKPNLTLSLGRQGPGRRREGGRGIFLYSNGSFLEKKRKEKAPKCGWYVRIVPYLINNFRRSGDYQQHRQNPWPLGFTHTMCVYALCMSLCVCVCVFTPVEPIVSESVIIVQQFPLAGVRERERQRNKNTLNHQMLNNEESLKLTSS